MAKYLIEVEVDVDKVYDSIGINENRHEFNVLEAIEREMGWTSESGIHVNSIKELESDLTGKYVENEIGEKITEIINQDGENKTDGQCIDEIINYLTTLGLYKKK